MRLRELLGGASAGMALAIAYARGVLAGGVTSDFSGDDIGGLPAPGILGLLAAVVIGTILLARRGK